MFCHIRLFSLSDDQGYADVGYHNPKCPISTPTIDRLANGGIRLENYYVYPKCSLTRAALLTGNMLSFIKI